MVGARRWPYGIAMSIGLLLLASSILASCVRLRRTPDPDCGKVYCIKERLAVQAALQQWDGESEGVTVQGRTYDVAAAFEGRALGYDPCASASPPPLHY